MQSYNIFSCIYNSYSYQSIDQTKRIAICRERIRGAIYSVDSAIYLSSEHNLAPTTASHRYTVSVAAADEAKQTGYLPRCLK